ncbi:MAG TPA: universal stress protein [Actinomycetota bacterium]|nr:universal stress protein [Actinomycetota bacterium]
MTFGGCFDCRGPRDRGGDSTAHDWSDLLLGSVSQQCANHAGCPVVIVRHLHPNR